jgi:hypothetical protein
MTGLEANKTGVDHWWPQEGVLYVGNKLVPLISANQFLQMVEECRPLFVWDAGERIIWIFAFQVDDQFGKFMRFAKLGDRIRQRFPSDDGGEIAMRFTMSSQRSV